MCQASLSDNSSICDFSLEGVKIFFYRLVKGDSQEFRASGTNGTCGIRTHDFVSP